MTYFFILGKNPKLSIAEIKSVIKNGKFVIGKDILFLETNERIDVEKLIKRLGGTIKIGEIIGEINNLDKLNSLITKELPQKDSKIYFGISNYSNYSARDIKRVAMEIKKELRKSNPACPPKLGERRGVRWVSSKEKILSSVIVKTNNLLDKGMEVCLFDNGKVGKTLVVQEFEELEKRDYGKPARDIIRGMIPPKLAKIMINLAEAKKEDVLLDPFCGTGTFLMEELLMGYKNLIGSDSDKEAISQTKKNLDWLKIDGNIQLVQSKAEELSKNIKPNSVDVIITEPYLGPLLKGSESKEKVKRIINELENLYLNSFKDWKKILKKNGKVVIIFPILKNQRLNIYKKIEVLGYISLREATRRVEKISEEDLIYKRPGQKVLRSIDIFKKID